jgi:hypothetical protein
MSDLRHARAMTGPAAESALAAAGHRVWLLTARRTTQTTTTSMTIRHAARFPALRWYAAAVVSSLAAASVSAATECTFASMLSVPSAHAYTAGGAGRTELVALLEDERVDVPEDLVQLVDPALDVADLGLALLDQLLLVQHLRRRELLHLRLRL